MVSTLLASSDKKRDNEWVSLQIQFPAELPVSQNREEISSALKNHQVIIVAGETGSGKTTQLPKIALALGRKKIAHTQPRRIAARAVAERIAEELDTPIGDVVGYQVRFTDKVSKNTKIRLMTDGILLAQIHKDRNLKRYDTIIIDEAHERSLNIDFLIGYLKRLLPKRPDLKVIITSATIDPQSFAKHFSNHKGEPAPIIEVSGRTYPVDVKYQPLENDDMITGVQKAVAKLMQKKSGDILVFLSGESEIKDAQEAISSISNDRLEVLPLYGRLSAAEQHRVFGTKAPGKQRVVLATNVAETSLTVPGIKYVIDTGLARVSRWSTRSKVQRLPIEAISKASANQRAGRAGRLSAGEAIRLYSEDDYESRIDFTEPEILRTGLAAVILQMLTLGLGDIAKFPFLTPPDKRGVSAGLQLLRELGAVRENKITKIGKDIARLPIEPRFGRMILEAFKRDTVFEVIVITAGLTVQDVRERPEEEREKADQLHARFRDPQGDLITILNLWKHLEKKQKELSGNAFRRMCKSEYLNYLRVREWRDLVRQISDIANEISGFKKTIASDYENIHRAVLSGLLSQLGLRDDTQKQPPAQKKRRFTQEYIGSRGRRFVIHPSSVLARKPPEMIMSVELVETSRLFARANALVDPAWAEELAHGLTKRTTSEPHWEKNFGQAVAYEKILLFGIPLVEKRRFILAKDDPEHARELFIRHALVEGDWFGKHTFDRANWQLRRELEALEARNRRRDMVADDDAIFDFYDARIPKTVTSQVEFEKWWKSAGSKTPRLLHLQKEDLLEPDAETGSEFPRVWSFGDQQLKLRYRFDPTAEDDGVSVLVPLPLLPRISNTNLSSLVPGMREEYVQALIRSLPKNIRKHVVPAADWAKKLLIEISPQLEKANTASTAQGNEKIDDQQMLTLLAASIQRLTSQIVTPENFDLTKLPNHLRPTFTVINERGKKVASSKNLEDLKTQFKDVTAKRVAKLTGSKEKTSADERVGITSWDFGDLSRAVDTKYDSRGGAGKVRAYPTLVDRRKHVDLRYAADIETQAVFHPRGVARLLSLTSPNTSSYLNDHLSNEEKLVLAAGPFENITQALNEVLLLIANRLVGKKLVFTAAEFALLEEEYARESVQGVFDTIKTVVEILKQARKTQSAIEKATSLQTLNQVTDAKNQLNALIYRGFLSEIDPEYFLRLPVYLKALTYRMNELSSRAGKDRVWLNEIESITKIYTAAGGAFPARSDSSPEVLKARWLIEEMRISLFAQSLGTKEKVSKKRITELLQK